jgi:hypothetical protein
MFLKVKMITMASKVPATRTIESTGKYRIKSLMFIAAYFA